ncbi:SPFH domain-containing protein [Mucisphaera sp.]|uniref:SPFH domain-containing protein n=1 Tax=Mucisphaera sp. TaxID=2913024 RepID=UPI003D0CE6DB
MAKDALTYRRATNAAITGLCTQAALFAAFGLLGLYAQAGAITALTWHAATGLPIWITLILLFYQQRLEQEEALEAERLSRADVRAAALFEEAGANLQLARQRLDWLNKWGLTIASIFTASLMLIVGPALLYNHYLRVANDAIEPWIRPDVHSGLLIILLATIAFITFLVGRFLSGMTRTDEYQALRGGASALMGIVFLTILAIIAAVAHLLGLEPAFEWLALAIPAITTLVGLEMVANLTLALYQPKRPGQFRRPGFDSRLLGWMSSPESIGKIVSETIAYQFGFDLSRSQAYQQVMRLVTPMFLTGIAVLLAMTSIVVVQPHQQAVIITFGALDRDRGVLNAGLHFKAPWPISTIDRYDVYRVNALRIGSAEGYERIEDAAILWTNDHIMGDEDFLVTAPSRFPDQPESEDVAAGELIGGDVIVKYRINPNDGLLDFITSADDPDRLFTAISSRQMNQYFATRQIDDLLRADRIESSRRLRGSIQSEAEASGLGVEVLSVSIISMHPPQKGEVAQSFHDQIDALQESLSEVNRANRDAITTLAEVAGSREQALEISEAIAELESLRLQAANGANLGPEIALQEALIEQLVSEAGGEAAQRIAQARAFRWQYAIEERAKAEQFPAELEAYSRAPDYFKARRYYEALTESLQDRPKIVLTDPDAEAEANARVIQLDLQETRTGLESILGN